MTAVGLPRESNMRSSTAAALVIGTVLAIPASPLSLVAGDPDACSLLGATEVGAALGVAIGAGQHPASPLGGSGNLRTCQWYEPGKTGGPVQRCEAAGAEHDEDTGWWRR